MNEPTVVATIDNATYDAMSVEERGDYVRGLAIATVRGVTGCCFEQRCAASLALRAWASLGAAAALDNLRSAEREASRTDAALEPSPIDLVADDARPPQPMLVLLSDSLAPHGPPQRAFLEPSQGGAAA